MPEVTDLMRVAQWAKSSNSPSDVYNAACRLLDEHSSRRAEALQSWTTGLNEWGRRSLELLNATEKGAESNGGGRTPQTGGAVEGQEAREAQGVAQCPTQCDQDCEAGKSHCAEVHAVRWQRSHQPEDCPAVDATATQ